MNLVGVEGFEPPDILLPKQARYQTALYPDQGANHTTQSIAGQQTLLYLIMIALAVLANAPIHHKQDEK